MTTQRSDASPNYTFTRQIIAGAANDQTMPGIEADLDVEVSAPLVARQLGWYLIYNAYKRFRLSADLYIQPGSRHIPPEGRHHSPQISPLQLTPTSHTLHGSTTCLSRKTSHTSSRLRMETTSKVCLRTTLGEYAMSLPNSVQRESLSCSRLATLESVRAATAYRTTERIHLDFCLRSRRAALGLLL
jgi:hypothetical protein